MYEGMLPMDEVLRQSGQFGPKVEVPDDADEQTSSWPSPGAVPDAPVTHCTFPRAR